ncbi:methyltransferase type 12 [candidate division FCPU426 bacterium]|nr:methyltransferase type 12 [candidate division FCPU426 bacterium]
MSFPTLSCSLPVAAATSGRTFSADLNQWLPRLIHVWRTQCRRPGTKDRLLPFEIQQLARAVQHLSAGLTGDRHLAGREYLSDPFLLGAYLLYFWPISYIQARYALQALPHAPQRSLELGAGSGPFSAACHDLGTPVTVLADRSVAALRQADKISRLCGWKPHAHRWVMNRPLDGIKGRYDIICLQNLLNELQAPESARMGKICRLLQSLSAALLPAGFILIIEPALTSTSRVVLQVRNHFLRQGWSVVFPCLHQNDCPALIKSTDSCHLDLDWQAPGYLKALVKTSGFKKREIKMTAFLLTPPGNRIPAHWTGEMFLIVSEPLRSKNKRLRYIGCGPMGRIGLALKPEEKNPGNSVFFTLKKGDIIRVQDAKKTDEGFHLLQNSVITLVHRCPK